MSGILKTRIFLNIKFWEGNVELSTDKDTNPNNLSIEFLVNKKDVETILATPTSKLEFLNVHYKEQFDLNNYINSLSKNDIKSLIESLTSKLGGQSTLLKF